MSRATVHRGLRPADTRERGPRRRLRLAVLGAVVAVCLLGYRVSVTLSGRRPAERLRLASDVPLTPPPPAGGSDLARLRERLGALHPPSISSSLDPAGVAAILEFCRSAVRAGDTLTALRFLRSVDPLEKRSHPALEEMRGRCEMALDLPDEALATFRQLARTSPGVMEPWLMASRALAAQGREEEALRELERAGEQLRNAPLEARLALAAELEQRGALLPALAEVRRLQGEYPESLRPRTAAGRLLFKLQRMEEAQAELRAARNVDTGDRTAGYYLAVVSNNPLTRERDPGLTEDLLLRNIQGDPADRASLQRLGELYQEQERYREAAHVYTQLLEAEPDLAAGRSQLARAYARLGQREASAEQQAVAQRFIARDREEDRLTAACREDRKKVGAWLSLARHYERHGQHTKALRALQSGYCASPSAPEMRDALRAFYRRLQLPEPVLPGNRR